MSTTFDIDLKNSLAADNFVFGALRHFGFQRILSCESTAAGEVGKRLDTTFGVDIIADDLNDDTVFLAKRVIRMQKPDDVYHCFSLRTSRSNGNATELDKLRRAIKMNLPRPQYHVQAFLSANQTFADVGLIRTNDLISYLDAHEPIVRQASNAKFLIAPWRNLIREGVNVKTIRVDSGGKKIGAFLRGGI